MKFPEDNARLDLTDLDVDPAPGEPGRTLPITENPFTTE
jgi:hypothetical protein